MPSRRIQVSEVDHDTFKKTAEVLNVSQIHEIKRRSHYDPRRYRMFIKVTSPNSNQRVKGLIDTGANIEVLSLDACRRLGIAHRIRKSYHNSTGVDGHQLGVIGEVHATIYVGDVPYTAQFQVLKHISSSDIMIGTRFLLQSNLMEKIYNVVGEGVGARHLSKGN